MALSLLSIYIIMVLALLTYHAIIFCVEVFLDYRALRDEREEQELRRKGDKK